MPPFITDSRTRSLRLGDRQKNYEPQRADAGFALVIALVLMGFVLVLALSLGSLVRVNLTGVEVQEKQLLARQNALLGVNVALGQLQLALGNDQHTSTRADILAKDLEDDEDVFSNPLWTAAWDKDGNLLTYLVSGNEAALNAGGAGPRLDARDSVAEDKQVMLVRALGGVPEVVAQKTTIETGGQVSGSYAYWIGDEGVKAKVNLSGSGTAPTGLNNPDLMFPRHFGISRMAGMSWFDPQSPAVDILFNSGSLQQLAPAGATPRELFHDITTYSYGVLSDSRKGGLKKDLTVGLQATSAQPAGQIFDPVLSSSSTGEDPGGPLWQQLRSWASASLVSGELPVRAATDDQAGFYPLIAGFQIYFVPSYNPSAINDAVSGSSVVNSIWTYVIPAIMLWNPYDVPLQQASYRVQAGRASSADQTLGNVFLFDSADPVKSSDVFFTLQTNEDQYGNAIAFETETHEKQRLIPRINNASSYDESLSFRISNVSLEPGEMKVFSPSQNGDFWGASRNLTHAASIRHYGYKTPARGGLVSSSPLRKLTVISPVPSDTSLGSKALDYYSYHTINPTHVGGVQLFLNSSSGEKLLTDALYLNLTRPSSNTVPPPAQMQRMPANSSAALDVTHALGWKIQRRFSTYDSGLFGEHTAPGSDYKWLAQYNPRAATSGPSQPEFTLDKDVYYDSSTNNPSFVSIFEYEQTNMDELPDASGLVLFEGPPGLENLFSIGQLTHAPLYYWNDQTTEDGMKASRIEKRMANSRFDNLIPANPIGNSGMNPFIKPGATYRNFAEAANPNIDWNSQQYYTFEGILYDYSYLLNEALFDAYFFSSLAVPTAGGGGSYAPRNPRIVAIEGHTNLVPGLETSASKLYVDGAFNINSTSVEAWKAVLSAFYGKQVNRRGGSMDVNAERAAFLRTSVPVGSIVGDTAAASSAEARSGYRALSDSQISALATAIVEEIKARGPATTLAAFINRKPSSDVAEQQLAGTLTAAIASVSDINAAIASGHSASLDTAIASYSQAIGTGATTEGLPGWLTSADILARLGSVLSARSDTFIIRASGQYINPATGGVESTAYCEAIVQRLPEYVSSVNLPQASPSDGSLSEVNRTFGRKFQIISFRWLSEDEL